MKLTTELIPDGSDALAGAALASEYYGGMMSALYAVSSTGSLELYPGEGLGRLIKELRDAVNVAQQHYPEDYDALSAFLAWAQDMYDSERPVCDTCGDPCDSSYVIFDNDVAYCGPACSGDLGG